MKFKKLIIFISTLLIVIFGYQIYLRYPQRYEVGSCVKDSQLNEVYKVISTAKRQTSFKDHWLFAPMGIEIKVIEPNPNAHHEKGDVRLVDQEDKFLSSFSCTEVKAASGLEQTENINAVADNVESNQQIPIEKLNTNKNSDSSNPSDTLSLNSGSFEGFVLKCFAGAPCNFDEDPKKMYQEFKASGNRRATDSLISFMRSQLKNKEFRDQYKDSLKEMINDFYTKEERQFQEAAYYNYLGDLQKSLDIYLDLQRKSQSDPSLKPAPQLNIANTLYDMRRYKESLPYYEAALQESLSQQVRPTPNPESFIESRISEIKNKF